MLLAKNYINSKHTKLYYVIFNARRRVYARLFSISRI